MRLEPVLSILFGLLLVSGCAGGGGFALQHDIELDGADGAKRWKLEPEPGEVELEGPDSVQLGSFEKVSAGHIRAKSASGEKYDIRRTGRDAVVHERDSGVVRYTLHRESDGDYELLSGSSVLYEIKVRDYGFKVVADGEEMKVRHKDGKTSIRDGSGKTLFSTRDAIPTLAAACFTFDQLPETLRAGLALAVIEWEL